MYNPKKRARFGVNIYKVCESSTGYCCDFKIYVGDDKCDDLLSSESVVLVLMQPFLKLVSRFTSIIGILSPFSVPNC